MTTALQSSVWRDFWVLARAHAKALRGKAQRNLKESRLLTGTLVVFLMCYQLAAFFIFRYGLDYLYGLPGIGLVLIERVHHMLFFLFFVMLAFSNSILLYSGIFRVQETAWLLTLPLNHRAIFLWKVVEAFLVSSWGVVIITAPMLIAFGSTFRAPPEFYPKALLLYVPYLLLPATLAAMLVMLLVHYWGKVMKYGMFAALALLAYYSVKGWQMTRRILDANTPGGTSEAIAEVLGHTGVASHPLLPSTWVSEQLFLWMRGFQGHSWFHACLILSCSLFGLWLCAELFSRFTFNCWVRSQGRKAQNTQSTSQRLAAAEAGEKSSFSKNPLEYIGISRLSAALIWKDVREFTRDSSQWIPFSVIYGLMFLYRLNLRSFDQQTDSAFWAAIVRYLNFGVCALVVSTLTTRFIFPIYSLEGRRLWILGLAPLDLRRVFWLKLLLYSTVIGGASASLMFLGGTQERLPWSDVWSLAGGIMLQSFGMTALSLGLGVIFPNYQESNPAKIVSSYGGTLCLIVNFLYIALFLGLFVVPGLAPHIIRDPAARMKFDTYAWLGMPLAAILTLVSAGVVIFLALRQIKRLEHLRKL